MAARFEIEVLTKFRSLGLNQIAQEARSALAQVASQPGLSAATRATRANQVRTSAEQAITETSARRLDEVRSSGLTGNALAQAEQRIKSETAAARAALTRAGREITDGATKLGRVLTQAAQKSGVGLLSAEEARKQGQAAAAGGAGGGGGQPPVVTPAAAPPPPPDKNSAEERARRAKEAQDAKTRSREMLAADDGYIKSKEDERKANREAIRKVAERLRVDDQYINDRSRIMVANREEYARARERAVATERYKRANLDLARASAQEAADRFRRIAGDRPTIVARAEGDIQQQRIRAAEAAIVTADPRTYRAQQVLARAQSQQAAGIASILAGDDRYTRSQVQLARANAQKSANVAQALAADGAYARAQQTISRSKATQQATLQQALASDNQYLRAQAVITRSKAQQAASIAEALASDRAYAQAQARTTAAKARQAAEAARLLAGDAAYTQSQLTTARAKAQQRADLAQAKAADSAYIQATARTTAARAQEQAQIQAALAADASYAASTALAARARQAQATRQRAVEFGIPGAGTLPIRDLEPEIALRSKIRADLDAAAATRLQAAQERTQGSALAAASAQRRQAERELTAAIHSNARAEVRQAIAAGEGTRFQRLQARFQAGGSTRLPSEFQTLGGFTGSRALTTIGYGIAGTALYGSVRAIGDMIREAEELDRVLNQVKAQLDAVGSGGQFEGARQGILRIARETGAAADEVAKVQFQFQGAFGAIEGGGIDAAKALVETEAAMKVVAVTGLSLNEVLDSLTATARTFGVGIEEIGDVALGVQERFGVLATETITFVADLAPVADQIGLSLEDLASLGGVAQQVSGKSGAALAEGFGRVFPQLQELRDSILEIYDLPQLAGNRQSILESFALGETGAVFQQLVRDFNSLSKAQQQFVIDMLGGRREAQVVIPVLQNASLLTADWDRNLQGLNDTSGKTDDYFDDLQKTVGNAAARFGEAVRQIGEGLFRAGAADAFVAITNAAAGVADMIVVLINLFGALNRLDFLPSNAPVKLLAYAAAFRILRAVMGVVARQTIITTIATKSATVANQAQAAGFTRVAAAATTAAAAVSRDTAADLANVGSSNAAGQANRTQYTTQGQPIPGPTDAGVPQGGQAPSGTPPPRPPGRLASFGQTLSAGGTLFGRQIGGRLGGVLNIGRSFSGFVGLSLALEGLNQFFQNSADQASELDKLRSEIAGKFAETEDIDATIAELNAEAAQKRSEVSNVGVTDLGILNKPVNFIGGNFRKLLGVGSKEDNDAILRSAAGKPQDFEVLERAAYEARSEEYTKIVTAFLANDRGPERLIEALNESNADGLLQDALLKNLEFASDETKALFLDKGAVTIGAIGVGDEFAKDFANGLIDKDELTEEAINTLIEQSEDGDLVAIEMLRLISDYINTRPELAALLESGTQKQIDDAARKALGGEGGFQLQTIDEARAALEAGASTTGVFLDEALQARKGIADAISAAGAAGQEPLVADLIALAKSDQEIAEVIGNVALSRIDALGQAADLLSGGAQQGTSDALIDVQIAEINRFISSNTGTQEQQFEQIPVLIGLLRDKFERDLAGIADETERARVEALGFELPPELQALFVEQQLARDPAINRMIKNYASAAGVSLDTAFTEVANLLVETEKTVQQIMLDQIAEKIRLLEETLGRLIAAGASGASLTAINKALAALYGVQDEAQANQDALQPVELGSRGYAGGGADDAAQRAEEARRAARARAEAQIDLQRAYAEGDPVRLAQLDLQAAEVARQYAEDDAQRLQAEADRVRAWDALREAQADIDKARFELYAAQVQRDPVRAAQAQVALAYIGISQARGTAERLRAQIQMVNAQRTLVDAQKDVQTAWLEGVISYFTLIGDSVKAAQIALIQAQIALQEVLADSTSGQAERTRARTAVQQAEAQLRNSKFDDQLGDIEYMLELEKISVAQAIQMLQRMAEIPGLTEEQLRNIERRIRALRQEVSGDLAFNLPDIKLPTLYEVRRLMGSGQTASGTYQDNRQIQVIVQISENVDAGPVIAQIGNMLDAPSVTGIYPRNY